MKNYKICKAFLLQNGFNEPELDGVTTYMVLRYGSSGSGGKLSKAKAYVKGVRSAGISSVVRNRAEDLHVPVGVVDVHAVRSNIVAINGSATAPRR